MTNSQVLQYIIEELGKTTLSWSSDKELFELICAPLSYGHDTYQKRKKIKKALLALYQKPNFDTKKFHLLAENIVCGDNENKYREELKHFLLQQPAVLNMSNEEDMISLVYALPCKPKNEKNYKNNFNNWKNGKTDRINCQKVKQRLEKNFHFSASLWGMHRTTIKQTIRKGVAEFVKQKPVTSTNITTFFKEIRSEFNIKEEITKKEKVILEEIKGMPKKQIKKYILDNTPLSESHSQDFIQALIPLLQQKGCDELFLEHVIEALDIHLQETNQIKKIKADVLGSPFVGEYLKAFNYLSSIETEDVFEIIHVGTEAISNVKRHYLGNVYIGIKERQGIVHTLIKYYKDIFNYKDTFHYCPAVNLAYMLVIDAMMSDDKAKCNLLNETIDDIYAKCKRSIVMDQNSTVRRERYYSNMAKLELYLLKGADSPVAEIARFLEFEESTISLIELTKTRREMQCLIDIAGEVQGLDHPRLRGVESAIAIIDDFMEFKLEAQ